jgi:exosortase/archaeosortase family protein
LQAIPVVDTIPGSFSLRLPARLALLGGLFAVELLLISIWLDAELLRGRGVLANLVHDWGAWSVRLGVAIVLGSLIFAESRAKSNLERLSTECSVSRIAWSLLAAHAAMMLLFVRLSSMVFQQNASEAVGNILVLAWGCTGLISLGLAACAIVPVRTWIDIFRSTGDAWIYGLGAALVACILGKLAMNLWVPLSHWTLAVVAMMLRPFVGTLIVDPATMLIGTPSFQVEIAPECSGYEGMGLILAFSSAWLWFFRRQWRFPQALLLIPAAVAIVWVANAARIAGLLLIGNAGAEKIAAGGFHSQAGWIAFNVIAIGTCVLAKRIPALVVDPVSDAGTANPTAPYLMPFLAILAAAMISRAASSNFECLYPLRVLCGISGAVIGIWIGDSAGWAPALACWFSQSGLDWNLARTAELPLRFLKLQAPLEFPGLRFAFSARSSWCRSPKSLHSADSCCGD